MPKIAELWNFFSQKSHGKNQKVHGKKLDICLKNAWNFSLCRRGYIRFARGLLINPIKRRQKRRHFTPFFPQCTATVSSFGAPVMWLFVAGFGDILDLKKGRPVSVLGQATLLNVYYVGSPTVGPLQPACISMCRHIYDWNIVYCDVKQPIHLTSHVFKNRSFDSSFAMLMPCQYEIKMLPTHRS